VVAGGLLALGAAVFVALLLASLHVVGGNSDGATVVLEGQALRSGHVLLSGWSLSYDSFWSLDAPFYALAVLLAGVRTALLNVVPCVIATAVVLVAVVLATERRRGAAAIAAAATVLGLLALPGRALSLFFLAGPYHVATVLFCLVGFAALRRGTYGPGFFVAVVAFAAGLLGDLQTLELGMLPALGAGALALYRSRDWRAEAPRLVAPVVAGVVAVGVRVVAVAIGSFSIARANPFASGHEILANARHLFSFGAALVGLDAGPFGPSGVPLGLALVHVVGLAVVLGGPAATVVGVLRTLRRAAGTDKGPSWRLDEVLLFAFVGDAVAFVVLPITESDAYARYLTGAVVFGAVLGARRVGDLMERIPARRRSPVAAAGLSVLALFAAGFALSLRGPSAPRPAAGIVPFLLQRGLTVGVGDYWSSSIVSVESGGSVLVRPVVSTPEGKLLRYDKQSAAGWYTGTSFQFYLYDSAFIWNGDDRAAAVATFGRPARTYVFGSYRVLVFPRRFTVSVAGSSGP